MPQAGQTFAGAVAIIMTLGLGGCAPRLEDISRERYARIPPSGGPNTPEDADWYEVGPLRRAWIKSAMERYIVATYGSKRLSVDEFEQLRWRFGFACDRDFANASRRCASRFRADTGTSYFVTRSRDVDIILTVADTRDTRTVTDVAVILASQSLLQ
jgi:hypothetical protein